MKPNVRVGLVAGLTALLGASCSSQPDTARPPQRPAMSSPMEAADEPKGDAPVVEEEDPRPADAPNELRFTAPALGGGTIDGADYAGHDLVMWFWAPW